MGNSLGYRKLNTNNDHDVQDEKAKDALAKPCYVSNIPWMMVFNILLIMVVVIVQFVPLFESSKRENDNADAIRMLTAKLNNATLQHPCPTTSTVEHEKEKMTILSNGRHLNISMALKIIQLWEELNHTKENFGNILSIVSNQNNSYHSNVQDAFTVLVALMNVMNKTLVEMNESYAKNFSDTVDRLGKANDQTAQTKESLPSLLEEYYVNHVISSLRKDFDLRINGGIQKTLDKIFSETKVKFLESKKINEEVISGLKNEAASNITQVWRYVNQTKKNIENNLRGMSNSFHNSNEENALIELSSQVNIMNKTLIELRVFKTNELQRLRHTVNATIYSLGQTQDQTSHTKEKLYSLLDEFSRWNTSAGDKMRNLRRDFETSVKNVASKLKAMDEKLSKTRDQLLDSKKILNEAISKLQTKTTETQTDLEKIPPKMRELQKSLRKLKKDFSEYDKKLRKGRDDRNSQENKISQLRKDFDAFKLEARIFRYVTLAVAVVALLGVIVALCCMNKH